MPSPDLERQSGALPIASSHHDPISNEVAQRVDLYPDLFQHLGCVLAKAGGRSWRFRRLGAHKQPGIGVLVQELRTVGWVSARSE